MTEMNNTLVFLGNGRCFHTMDWFRSAQKYARDDEPVLITDLIDGESFHRLTNANDRVEKLVVLDPFLLPKQSLLGNVWRNVMKLLALPVQVLALRKILRKYNNPVIHAHAMYYIVLARFSGRRYVATPQGSELLVNPYRSRLYKLFARIGLSRATEIVVDSAAMRDSVQKLYQREAKIIQNGIDVAGIVALQDEAGSGTRARTKLVSIRGFAPNYQIDRLVEARNQAIPETPIYFSYPFSSAEYKSEVSTRLADGDQDLGRLNRKDLYKLLLEAKLVVSIPKSDSSPRSVYESIFCGCAVAVTPGGWINHLPKCMASRLVMVDLTSPTWLTDALHSAERILQQPYQPSSEALDLFDQDKSYLKYCRDVYPSLTLTI